MPEGPEVRKYADALDKALSGRAIVSLEARTKDARKWLHENEPRLVGRRGATAADEDRKRMASDPSLVYQPGREYGTRHMVFRRTNLPCLRCGKTHAKAQRRSGNRDSRGVAAPLREKSCLELYRFDRGYLIVRR